MAQFYDGTRMRERYPGEQKGCSNTLVVLQFVGIIFYAAWTILRDHPALPRNKTA